MTLNEGCSNMSMQLHIPCCCRCEAHLYRLLTACLLPKPELHFIPAAHMPAQHNSNPLMPGLHHAALMNRRCTTERKSL